MKRKHNIIEIAAETISIASRIRHSQRKATGSGSTNPEQPAYPLGRAVRFAYAAVWMALGCGLLTITLTAAWVAPLSYLPAAIVALVWHASPIKQRCINACNAHLELAAFGAADDYSAIRLGLTHAVWCAGSCWVLMLFPMLLFRGHLPRWPLSPS